MNEFVPTEDASIAVGGSVIWACKAAENSTKKAIMAFNIGCRKVVFIFNN
jgi:hypothetical protein